MSDNRMNRRKSLRGARGGAGRRLGARDPSARVAGGSRCTLREASP